MKTTTKQKAKSISSIKFSSIEREPLHSEKMEVFGIFTRFYQNENQIHVRQKTQSMYFEHTRRYTTSDLYFNDSGRIFIFAFSKRFACIHNPKTQSS